MRNLSKLISAMSIAGVLIGCSSTGPASLVANDSFELTYPVEVTDVKHNTGSIFDRGAKLYPAGRSYAAGTVEVGDIITIILKRKRTGIASHWAIDRANHVERHHRRRTTQCAFPSR